MDGFPIKYVQKNNYSLSPVDPIKPETLQKISESQHSEPVSSKDRKDISKVVEQVQKAVKDINQKLELINTRIVIDLDQNTGKAIFKIVDTESGEVIKQVPPESLLKISAHISEYMNKLENDSQEKQVNRVV